MDSHSNLFTLINFYSLDYIYYGPFTYIITRLMTKCLSINVDDNTWPAVTINNDDDDKVDDT